MKSVAKILGILGGIAMFVTASFYTFIVAVLAGESAPAACESGLIMVCGLGLDTFGLAAVFLSIMGIIGGALTRRRSNVPGILMLVSGIGGIIAISRGFIFGPCSPGGPPWSISVGVFGGVALIIGGVLALRAK